VRSRERNLFSPDPTFNARPLTIAWRAEAGDIPAGWNLSLTAAETELLAEGVYGIDAKILATGGTVDITDATALVRFTKAAVA
jgi:hypothetical protein